MQDALSQIGQQLAAEKDAELQTLLSAAFVRLSQEAASRRYYRAMQQALDSLADLEELRPAWAQSLRPRMGVENRISEFIEEALTAEAMPEGLVGVLMRIPQGAGEHLAVRMARSGRRTERENVVQLAKAVGSACARYLKEVMRSESPSKGGEHGGTAEPAGPLKAWMNCCRSDCATAARSFHDAVVRQLSIAGAPERGQMLTNSIEVFDVMVLPLALDEIGMCGDQETAPKLLRLAEGDILAGRLRVSARESDRSAGTHAGAGRGWAHAAFRGNAQGVWLGLRGGNSHGGGAGADEARSGVDDRSFLPQSGLDDKVMALAPLDPIPDRDVVRHRRYRRIRLPRNVPAVITSARGKYSSAISVLSLEGGLLSGDVQLAVGTEATLKIPAGLRSISMQAVVRFVRSHQAGFEMVGMGLEDRAKLRRLLVSLGSPGGASTTTTTPTNE